MNKKYVVVLLVESDDDSVTEHRIHEGLCRLLHEQVEDGPWNEGKFAVTNVFPVSEVSPDE